MKKFDKKSDIDRRSFNIEAAIIEENINEEDEYDEEMQKKDKIEESISQLLQESIDQSRRDEIQKRDASSNNRVQSAKEKYLPYFQANKDKPSNNLDKSKMTEAKQEQKTNVPNSNNNNNFNDLLRTLRAQQFEKQDSGEIQENRQQVPQFNQNQNNINEKKKFFEENPVEEEEKILTDKHDIMSTDQKHGKIEHELLNQKGVNKNIFFSYKQNNDIENMLKNYEEVKKVITDDIKNTSKEELEFYEASKSLKFHRSNSTEEVIKDIKSSSLNDNNPLKLLENLTRSQSVNLEGNSGSIADNLLNDEGNQKVLMEFINQLQYLKKQKENFEELFAKKNLEIKLITKKSYEDAMNVRLMITNALIVICVAGVFCLYYYFRNKF